MNKRLDYLPAYFLLMIGIGLVSCTGTKELSKNNYQASPLSATQITSQLPDYQSALNSLKGKGRAIVSEPGNTERLTIRFSSNRSKSLVTIRNGIGIEGGKLLTDGDTLLVYNKVDKFARKIPIRGGNLNRINKLASLNILDMINYSVAANKVAKVLENESHYQLQLTSGTKIYVDKQEGVVRQVVQSPNSPLPYSKITYGAYSSVKGFTLPRRISIFGAEKKSKVALQLTGLDLNPPLGDLIIKIPDDIPVYHQ